MRWYYVYIITQKLLITKCFRCMKESTNKMGKNAVSVIRTNSRHKEQLLYHAQQTLIDRILNIPCATDLNRQESLIDIKRSLNWLKYEIINIGENLTENVKYIQISCKNCFKWLVVGCVYYREIGSIGKCELGSKNDLRYREVFAKLSAT